MEELKGNLERFSEEDRKLWPEAANWDDSGESTRLWYEPFRVELENGIVLVASNGMRAWFDFGGCVESEECYVRDKPIDNKAVALRLVDFFFRIVDCVTHDHLVNHCGFELE